MPSWRSSPGLKAGTTPNGSSPDWACAAQTNTKQRSTLTPPTSTPPSRLETRNGASNKAGDPHLDPVLESGVGPVSGFQERELSDQGVGGEGLVAPAVSLLQQRQLRARVRSFAADNDPHPGRPAAQIEQSGDLGDLGAVADIAVGGDRRRPHPFRNRDDGAGQRRVLGGEADRVLQPTAADLNGASQPVQQLMGGAGPVGPDQQPPPKRRRDLGDGPGQDVDVVPGVITAGVARPQADRQQLGGVVAPDADRVETEAARERRPGPLLLRVCGDQRGVDKVSIADITMKPDGLMSTNPLIGRHLEARTGS